MLMTLDGSGVNRLISRTDMNYLVIELAKPSKVLDLQFLN